MPPVSQLLHAPVCFDVHVDVVNNRCSQPFVHYGGNGARSRKRSEMDTRNSPWYHCRKRNRNPLHVPLLSLSRLWQGIYWFDTFSSKSIWTLTMKQKNALE